MQVFQREISPALVLDGVNCDTDQIIPGRFLKADRAQGYGQFLFHDIRRDAAGALLPGFALNRPGAEQAKILLVGDNFGCGSSREGAVYAIVDHGIRALIAPSFGDIFYNNALKNGLLPIRLAEPLCQSLATALQAEPDLPVDVDLEAGLLRLPAGLGAHPIEIDAFARDLLLQGRDELEMTLSLLGQIQTFEAARLRDCPWLDRGLAAS